MTETIKCACATCARTTTHEILYHLDTKATDPEAFEEYQVVQCRGCEAISFRHTNRSAWYGLPTQDGVFPAREFIFPPRHLLRRPVDENWLPPLVRDIYREVQVALRNHLSTLAAIGIRATVEALCAQKAANGNNLKERIDELQRVGAITDEQKQAFHAQRLLGNDAAHELANPADDEPTAAMDVLDSLLDSIYIMPKRRARMQLRQRQRKGSKK